MALAFSASVPEEELCFLEKAGPAIEIVATTLQNYKPSDALTQYIAFKANMNKIKAAYYTCSGSKAPPIIVMNIFFADFVEAATLL